MRKLLLLSTVLLISFEVVAQKYGTALGARIGKENYGISLRQKFLSNLTAEGLLTFQPDAFQFTVMPKYHFNIIGRGTNLYFGAGAHAGNLKDYGTFYGFNIITGVELKLPALPITISADVMPTYHVNHEDWFDFPAALTISLVLAKETREKRQKARKKRKKRKERKKRREERKEKRGLWFEENIFKNKAEQ